MDKSPQRAGCAQPVIAQSALPFSGLGFDLSVVLCRAVTVIRRNEQRPVIIIPDHMADVPMPAGRLLLVRLNREIRGR